MIDTAPPAVIVRLSALYPFVQQLALEPFSVIAELIVTLFAAVKVSVLLVVFVLLIEDETVMLPSSVPEPLHEVKIVTFFPLLRYVVMSLFLTLAVFALGVNVIVVLPLHEPFEVALVLIVTFASPDAKRLLLSKKQKKYRNL